MSRQDDENVLLNEAVVAAADFLFSLCRGDAMQIARGEGAIFVFKRSEDVDRFLQLYASCAAETEPDSESN